MTARATYGFRGRERAEVLVELEVGLGVRFEAGENANVGPYGYYPPEPRPAGVPEAQPSLRLTDNFDPVDGLPLWQNLPDVTALLDVSAPSREAIRALEPLVCERLGAERLEEWE
jgi:hypothetical protein